MPAAGLRGPGFLLARHTRQAGTSAQAGTLASPGGLECSGTLPPRASAPAPGPHLSPQGANKMQRSLSLKKINKNEIKQKQQPPLKNRSQGGKCLCQDLHFHQKSPFKQGDNPGPAGPDWGTWERELPRERQTDASGGDSSEGSLSPVGEVKTGTGSARTGAPEAVLTAPRGEAVSPTPL